jgi:hypothetical protein
VPLKIDGDGGVVLGLIRKDLARKTNQIRETGVNRSDLVDDGIEYRSIATVLRVINLSPYNAPSNIDVWALIERTIIGLDILYFEKCSMSNA